MKKFLLFFFLGFAVTLVVNSQSLQLADSTGPLVNNANVFKYGQPSDDEIVSHVFVKNATGAAISVMVKKVPLITLEGTENALCWGACFPPEIMVSPDPFEIGAGATDSSNFSGHYYPYDVVGISTVRYVFFDERNPSDSVCFNVSYSTFPQGFRDESNSVSVSAYPNPANQAVNFSVPGSHSQDARIIIRNLLGEVMSELPANGSAKLTVNTSGFAAGVYFYTYSENGNQIVTKKLVVRH